MLSCMINVWKPLWICLWNIFFWDSSLLIHKVCHVIIFSETKPKEQKINREKVVSFIPDNLNYVGLVPSRYIGNLSIAGADSCLPITCFNFYYLVKFLIKFKVRFLFIVTLLHLVYFWKKKIRRRRWWWSSIPHSV